ncbi:MAG: VCBS repeat-containing protein [Thermoanaerobaculia bacterium]|nr:VCBS repeat-containing protein [Thermoanaerobaculia bacterium]
MKKFLLVFVLLLAAVGAVFYFSFQDTRDPYVEACDLTVPDHEIPKFDAVEIAFTHRFDEATELPLTAGATIDTDGDGVDELFFGGGTHQPDSLFRFAGGSFEDISDRLTAEPNKLNTLGAVSFDLDEDGDSDLLVTRPNGVFLLRNTGSGFDSQRLDIEVSDKSTPATLTVGDFDRDGDADLFLSTYLKIELMEGQTIFNEKGYGSNSILLRNDGELRFTDVTESVGLTYTHNTFQAAFVDIDSDGWLDLVVAYDTGEARTYRNHGGETFSLAPNPMTGRFGYPMGLAVGDFNNDSRVDFFFSNTGSTVPKFLAKGDLDETQELVTDWILFRNDGNFEFSDVAQETKVASLSSAGAPCSRTSVSMVAKTWWWRRTTSRFRPTSCSACHADSSCSGPMAPSPPLKSKRAPSIATSRSLRSPPTSIRTATRTSCIAISEDRPGPSSAEEASTTSSGSAFRRPPASPAPEPS